MHYQYRTRMVCSKAIDFDLEGGIVSNIRFTGGCDGNLRAISKLLEGMPAREVIAKLKGNTCNGRPTSCADQLTQALEAALAREAAATANTEAGA